MGCNCGGRRQRADTNPTLVSQPRSDQQWQVTYSSGTTQRVPDERTARAIAAVNGGRATPVEDDAPSAS